MTAQKDLYLGPILGFVVVKKETLHWGTWLKSGHSDNEHIFPDFPVVALELLTAIRKAV